MNDLLAKIFSAKVEEVATARQLRSEAELLREAQARQDVRGFVQAIEDKIASGKLAIIAKVKKPASPSLPETFNPAALAASYAAHGATCLSVLTDVQFFQGSHDHLRQARAACPLPVLRKDFIIDPYQIIFSRALGADCVSLMAAALTLSQLTELESCAFELGMDVLIEIDHAAQLETALQLRTPLLSINHYGSARLDLHEAASSRLSSPHASAPPLGIKDVGTSLLDTPDVATSRLPPHEQGTRWLDPHPSDLDSCEATLRTTLDLLAQIPATHRVVTENSILHPQDIDLMRQAGVKAFLVGEVLLVGPNPGLALARLIP